MLLGNGTNTVTLGNGNDIVAASNGSNTITLGTGSDGVVGGNQNNTITIIGSATSNGAIVAGNGNNKLSLGAGTYNITAGHGSPDLFIYTTPSALLTMPFGSNVSGDNDGHGTSTPQAIAASLFSSNANGIFATTANRLAYDQSTGNLYYDAAGSAAGSTRMLIADFTNKPHLTPANLFFTS